MAVIAAGGAASLAGCAAELRGKREEQLIERYGEGIGSFNEGAEKHNDGVIAYRSDEYEAAVRVLSRAETSLGEAVEAFRDAERLAAESGNGDVERICREAVEKARHLHRATELLRSSSRAFAAGNYERAQNAYDQYKERYPLVNEKRIRDQQTVADAVDDSPFGLRAP